MKLMKSNRQQFILLSCVFLAAALLISAQAPAQSLTRYPYLQDMRQNSVVIMWRTDTETESVVEVWEEGSDDRATWQCNVPRAHHEMTIPELKPDSRYFYRVGHGNGFLSEAVAFRTFQDEADASGSGFEFVAYGDHRNNPEAHRSVVDAILKINVERGDPRFILDGGDYTGQGEMNPDPWNEQFFNPAQNMMDHICLYPSIGNHESYSPWPRIPHRYLENFAPPTDSSGTEYYYSFHYGNAHFIVIDSWATSYETESKQWAWIRDELRRSKKPWKIALFHKPPFAHRAAPNESYGDMNIREHLIPLFRTYGVSLVLNGDSHFYQRAEQDGIVYVTTAGGGAPIYTPAMPGEGADFIRASKKAFHFTRIRIEGDKLSLWAYDTDGKVFDKASFGPKKPELPPPPPLNFERKMPGKDMKAGVEVIVESHDAEGKITGEKTYRETGPMASSSAKSALPELSGKGSRFASAVYEPLASFTVTPPLKSPGSYLVAVTVPEASSVNSPNTIFEIHREDEEILRGKISLTASEAGNKWLNIGLVKLAPGDSVKFMQTPDEPNRFYADAVKFTRYE